MSIDRLHHYTLRCAADELDGLRDFYTTVLGLVPGDRPQLRYGGWWLYAGGQPVVHLYASGAAPSAEGTTLDHIAFAAHGLDATRTRLDALGVAWTEAPVPAFPLHQVFVRDPKGLKIELTFDLGAER